MRCEPCAVDRLVGETRIINLGSVGEAPGGKVAHATLVETSNIGVEARSFMVPLED